MTATNQLDCRNAMYFGPLLLALVVTVGCSSSPPPSQPSAPTPLASGAVPPGILNREQIARAILAEFPPDLREQRISGTVTLWAHVGTDGIIQEVQIRESSGYRQFDEAAMRVAVFVRFSPAIRPNGDLASVWVQFPVNFLVGRPGR